MNRSVIVLLCMFLLTDFSSAQLWKNKRYEAVAGLGTAQFFGDIGGFSPSENILGIKDFTFRQTRFNINGGLKYRITQTLSAKLGLAFGMLHATDIRGSNEERRMEATTTLFEPALTGEYYFIKSQRENSYLFSRGRRTRFNNIISSLDFYAFTGIGGLSYSVKGNDVLIARGMQDGGFTAVIPAGIGINLLILPDYNVGMEIGGRYAFSDYLEGYTSPYSRSNDVYYFFSFNFTYKLLTGRNGLPAFLNGGRRF